MGHSIGDILESRPDVTVIQFAVFVENTIVIQILSCCNLCYIQYIGVFRKVIADSETSLAVAKFYGIRHYPDVLIKKM